MVPLATGPKGRFDRWSSRYERSLTWRRFFGPMHDAMLSEAGDLRERAILDVGCGTGGMLRKFAGAGAARLVGVDTSIGMLDVADTLAAGDDRLEFVGATAESLPFADREFDLVTSCIAFHHFPEPEAALAQMRRVLVPGGRLLIADMCGEGPLGRVMLLLGRLAGSDSRYYRREQLAALATGAGFDVTATRLVRRVPPVMLLSATRPP